MRSLAAKTAVLTLAVVCGLCVSFAQLSTQIDGAKVIAPENTWSRAIESKDLKALDGILDEAFMYVDVDGRLMTKAEVLKDVKESGIHQVVTEAMVAHLHGDAAVITGSFRMKGVEGGKPYLRRGRFIDVWMYQNGSWVAISSQATLITH